MFVRPREHQTLFNIPFGRLVWCGNSSGGEPDTIKGFYITGNHDETHNIEETPLTMKNKFYKPSTTTSRVSTGPRIFL